MIQNGFYLNILGPDIDRTISGAEQEEEQTIHPVWRPREVSCILHIFINYICIYKV